MSAKTKAYAKALVAVHAAKLREAIHAVQAHESDPITIHKLAEVCAECAWCEREYGMERRKDEALHNQTQVQAL